MIECIAHTQYFALSKTFLKMRFYECIVERDKKKNLFKFKPSLKHSYNINDDRLDGAIMITTEQYDKRTF